MLLLIVSLLIKKKLFVNKDQMKLIFFFNLELSSIKRLSLRSNLLVPILLCRGRPVKSWGLGGPILGPSMGPPKVK